jgi:parallel beta-helix repeat protein
MVSTHPDRNPFQPSGIYRPQRRTRWFSAALWLSFAPSALAIQLDAGPVVPTLRPQYVPTWDSVPPLAEWSIDYDAQLSETDNGDRLKDRIEDLQPGDLLRVSAGRWSVNSFFQVDLQGTAAAPIRIVGESGAVLTRPNAGQNAINFGSTTAGATSYLLLRGFEVTGGSYGIRIQNVNQFWIDRCHVHHVAAVGIGANSHDTSGLHITRTEVDHTSSTGEGLYLGGNNGSVICRDGVFALNYVHDTGGDQGDGIELKGGSYGCLIAENTVHSTNYPGILVYGTQGNEVNVIEGNVVWDTTSNPFQVQGEAIVRNNLVFAKNGSALQSGPHQGLTTNLKIVGNTFIARDSEAAFLRSWGGQPGMVFANNVVYSETGESVHVNGGLSGVTVEDNVVLGPVWGVPTDGFFQGNGLDDFVNVSWDGARRDARPTGQSALRRPSLPLSYWNLDLTGAVRPAAPTVGALEPGTYGRYLGYWSANSPRIRARIPLVAGAPFFPIAIEAEPFSRVWVAVNAAGNRGTTVPGLSDLAAVPIRSAVTDSSGVATIILDGASLPRMAGQHLEIRSGKLGPSGPTKARRFVATAQ